MPTFVFTSPQGKKIRVKAPEGTTQEEAFARGMAQVEPETVPQGRTAPPATYPGAAERVAAAQAADPAPAPPMPQAPVAPAGPKADFSGVTATVSPRQETELDRFLTGGIDPVIAKLKERMPKDGVLGHLGQGVVRQAELASGGLESIAEPIRAIRQATTSDPKTKALLENAERNSRDREAQSGYRQAGHVAGDLAQWLIPASKVAGATKGAGLIPTMIAEGGLGAAQGAAQGTVGGESRKTNAIQSGALGAVLPFIAKGGVGDLAEHLPSWMGGAGISAGRARKVTALRDEAKRINDMNRLATADANKAATRAAQVANDAIDVERRQFGQMVKQEQAAFGPARKKKLVEIGRQIGAQTDSLKLPVTEARVRSLRNIQKRFGDELPPEFARHVDQMEAASKGGYITGKMAQQAKSAFGDAARTGKYNRTALHEAERVMTDTLKSGMSAEQADALEQIYRNYDMVYNSKFKPPTMPIRPKVRPNHVPAKPVVTGEDLRKPGMLTGTAFKRALIRAGLLRGEQDPEGGN